MAFFYIIATYAKKWYTQGLNFPLEWKKAAKQVNQETDKMKMFLEESYEFTNKVEDRISKFDLQKKYEMHFNIKNTSWLLILNELKRLKIRYEPKLRVNGTQGCIVGLKLKEFDEDNEDKLELEQVQTAEKISIERYKEKVKADFAKFVEDFYNNDKIVEVKSVDFTSTCPYGDKEECKEEVKEIIEVNDIEFLPDKDEIKSKPKAKKIDWEKLTLEEADNLLKADRLLVPYVYKVWDDLGLNSLDIVKQRNQKIKREKQDKIVEQMFDAVDNPCLIVDECHINKALALF